jgi:transposase
VVQAIDLPPDLASAHQLILQMHARLHEMQGEIVDLRHRLDVMARRMFGRRSEQLDPAQLELAFQALLAEEEQAPRETEGEEAESDAGDESEPRPRRRGHGRRRAPRELPRETRVIEPESTTCPCCGKPMTRIGESRSEQMDYVPATVRVIETVRPTYACGSCKEGVVSAPPPPSPVERGKASASLLAHVAVSKYADHLPLNRQAGILARQGVDITKQTLCGWIRQVSDILEPVEAAHWASILSSHVLQADETPVKVQDPPKKECRRAYFWAYVGDAGEVAFDFSMGRGSEAPLKALSGFRGRYLQADGYSGYGPVQRANPSMVRVGCMTHMRRKFYDARALDPERCLVLLARVRGLYEVEKDARAAATTREELVALRYVLRQRHSVPIMTAMHEDLTRWQDQVLPKSPVGGAVAYAINQWAELERFLEDGAIEIDNNAAERALRTVAVGRANWTFCGSEAGGAWAARLYGLLGTCRLQGIDPQAWLTDVLERVATTRPSRMHDLTPRGWKAARHPATADTR